MKWKRGPGHDTRNWASQREYLSTDGRWRIRRVSAGYHGRPPRWDLEERVADGWKYREQGWTRHSLIAVAERLASRQAGKKARNNGEPIPP